MARNGSGTYSRVSGTPYVNGSTISEVTVNAEMDDIATALTNSIAKDGQTSPSANLPMATYRHTGVGAGAALTDYARLDQLQNSGPQWLTSVSGTDTITASALPTPSAYAAGQTFRFVAAGANTGAATLNVSSLGAKSITKDGTTALVAGDIPSGAVVEVTYDGTQFQLMSKAEPMRIKSIQRGTIAITMGGSNATGSNTATISSVDTSKSTISMVGFRNTTNVYSSSATYYSSALVELTNSTTVTAKMYINAGGFNGEVSFEVVEYY